MSAGIVFHALAALAYAILAIWLWYPLAHDDKTEARAGRIGRTFLLCAIALHAVALYQAILANNQIHLGWALAFSAAIWLGMIVFWLESLFVRIDGLLLILLPTAALVAILGGLFPNGHLVPHANSDWLRIHLLIALTAYGLITVAALHSMLMAALDRQLHRPVEHIAQRNVLSHALDSMPPLLIQEQLLFRLIWIGFFVLTMAVISGALVSLRLSNTLFPLDHKTVFTLLSWLTFGGLLIGRYARGWRGRIALRWTLAGFAFLLLAYTGSRFVLEVILQRG